jgi:serine phosphatase RsbU (regulator of sigma subunit)
MISPRVSSSVMRLLPDRRGYLWWLVIRPLLFAVPFALFFCFVQGADFDKLGEYYVATLFFSFAITFAIEVNRRWVAPRLIPPDHPRTGPVHPLQAASYAVAAMLGSVAAGAILHYTIAPSTFGTGRDILLLLLYSALFVVLFLGVIYAVRGQRHLAARAREEQELRIAAEIQRALLPPRVRAGKGYDAAGASIPCRAIGGDFFEYFDLPRDRVGFVLGDVAGKGPPAALLAAMVQGIFGTNVDEDDGPAATLSRVNQALHRRGIETRFATIAYMVLTPDGRLVSCSAGHNPAYLLGRDGAVRRLEKGGLLVGPFGDAVYEEEAVALRPGDTLVLYSDGVIDAENPDGEQFGEERFSSLLSDGGPARTPEEILERVLDATRSFAAGHPPADDVTVLVVRYLGSPATS